MTAYLTLSEKKAAGAHYTPPSLARFVARQIVENMSEDCKADVYKILDPAIGDGELLINLRDELLFHGFSSLQINGFDTDQTAINKTHSRLGQGFDETVRVNDFTSFALEYRNAGSLFPRPKFDLIIANPPYVRTQVMGADYSQELAQSFGLSGRIDLYHVFLSGIACVLKPHGIAGVIVSNRFMTTRGGADIRDLLREEFDIIHIYDFGDTKLFEAAVLPAVLILRKRDSKSSKANPRFTTIYSTNAEYSDHIVSDIFDGIDKEGVIETRTTERFIVKQGFLDLNLKADQVWSLSNKTSDNWLSIVAANTSLRFGDIGKIRVGVKTTADKVFIRSDWNDFPQEQRPELLKPLITHHGATRFRSSDNSRQIVYPHEVCNGKRKASDLSKYQRTKKYLLDHYDILAGRSYVTAGGRNWYEIWVPQDPAAWASPKIVFRDISSEPVFWLDLTGAVVNGDCYWMKIDRESMSEDLLWLALAVGNSSFIEEFYDHSFNNKLYSGRRRFMSQYVEKFPIPDPESAVSQQIVILTKSLYAALKFSENKSLEKRIDNLVWRAFGLEEIIR